MDGRRGFVMSGGLPDGVFGSRKGRADAITWRMKPSSDPLVLKSHPYVGDTHPKAPEWHAVNVRLMENADIEGKVVYKGPKNLQVVEAFVLRAAA